MRRPLNTPYSITTVFGVPDFRAKFGRHSGVDYGIPTGRIIYAPTSGYLTNVVSNSGGNMVVIHDGKYWHRLMHNSSFSRGNGPVTEGSEVARSGSTGLSTGPHCHWDINNQGVYPTSFAAFIDPALVLNFVNKEVDEVIKNEDEAKLVLDVGYMSARETTSAERQVLIGTTFRDALNYIRNSRQFNDNRWIVNVGYPEAKKALGSK